LTDKEFLAYFFNFWCCHKLYRLLGAS